SFTIEVGFASRTARAGRPWYGIHMSELLTTKIGSVRRKHALLAAMRGACAMLGVAVLLLAVGMLLDWYIEFPWKVRAAVLAIDLTVLTYLFLTWVVGPVIWGP